MQPAATLKALAALKPAALRADLGFGKRGSLGFGAGEKLGSDGAFNFTDILDLSTALTSLQVVHAAIDSTSGFAPFAHCLVLAMAVCLFLADLTAAMLMGLNHHVKCCRSSNCIVHSF